MYTCYRRRVAKDCDLPYLRQDRLEQDLIDGLRKIALPVGVAEAVDAAVATYMSNEGRKAPRVTLKALEERQRRVNFEHEHEKISDSEWLAKCTEIDEQKAALSVKRSEPVFVRQRTMLSSMVEDWDYLAVAERKAVAGKVFEQITADADGLDEFIPREAWKDYVRAVVPLAEGGHERKMRGSGNSSARSGRARVAPAGGLAV
jgi:hypothetical protein